MCQKYRDLTSILRFFLVVFENGIPNLYDGGFENGEDILEWIVAESSGDHTIGK